jgi:hypothetical protein
MFSVADFYQVSEESPGFFSQEMSAAIVPTH